VSDRGLRLSPAGGLWVEGSVPPPLKLGGKGLNLSFTLAPELFPVPEEARELQRFAAVNFFQ